MQHADPERAAKIERTKRMREVHVHWKALMFPSRPPPPFVPRMVDEAQMESYPRGELFGDIIAAFRSDKFNDSPASFEDVQQPAQDLLEDMVSDATSPPDSSRPHNLSELEQKLVAELDSRNPFADSKRTADSTRTLFVCKLSPDVDEEDLRLFGERYGRVVGTRVVRDVNTQLSRKYGFIEFSERRDCVRAVDHIKMNSKIDVKAVMRPKIRGKQICAEFERGRQAGFVPRRFERVVAKRSTLGGVCDAQPVVVAVAEEGNARAAAAIVPEYDPLDDLLG